MVNLNENIRFLRKKKGWTQDKFSKKIGIKRSLVGAYEEGRADPRLNNLLKIADIFGGDNSCIDFAGKSNGNAYVDNCNTCDADSSNDCVQDCEGTWGGSAELDNCGICDGEYANDCK